MENKNNAVYKITVEVVDQGGRKVNDDLLRGIECNGFALVAIYNDEDCTVAINNTTTLRLAECFSRDGTIAAAAHIGEALREAREIERKMGRENAVLRSLESLFEEFEKKPTGVE